MTCSAPNHQSSSPSFGAATVLLADPDITVRDTVTPVLEREGLCVIQAADGQKVLDWLTRGLLHQNAHLLILEAKLPHLNGLDFCQLLRKKGHNLPILMISGRDSETDRVLGLEVGADDYLVKPFGIRELVARCRVLLRPQFQPRSKQVEELRYKDLRLNPSTCVVTLQGQQLFLTPKEFRLLELLMRFPKRVWEREQLIDQVWGTDYMGDSKTVDVHIRWLRGKIEQKPSQPEYIQTVRGFGYRLG